MFGICLWVSSHQILYFADDLMDIHPFYLRKYNATLTSITCHFGILDPRPSLASRGIEGRTFRDNWKPSWQTATTTHTYLAATARAISLTFTLFESIRRSVCSRVSQKKWFFEMRLACVKKDCFWAVRVPLWWKFFSKFCFAIWVLFKASLQADSQNV